MHTSELDESVRARRLRLSIVAVVCFGLAIPAAMAWLVNLDVAIQTVAPGWRLLLAELPTTIHQPLLFLSGDLSTISTLVPLLLLLFPLVQSLRILRRGPNDSASIHAMEALPYPAHFPFFLVMLGLTGTLYGLWIGLSASGVTTMTQGIPNAEELPMVLDRLLDGTATALLSSLLGLIGGFLAAQPLPYLFERAACLEPAEEERSLAETIDHLTHDLKALSAASREFGAGLQPEAVNTAVTALTALEASVKTQSAALQKVTESTERIETAQRDGVAHLHKLDDIAEAACRTGQRFDQMADLLSQVVTAESRLTETVMQVLQEVQAKRRESGEQLTALRQAVEQESAAANDERSRLQKAFAALAGR